MVQREADQTRCYNRAASSRVGLRQSQQVVSYRRYHNCTRSVSQCMSAHSCKVQVQLLSSSRSSFLSCPVSVVVPVRACVLLFSASCVVLVNFGAHFKCFVNISKVVNWQDWLHQVLVCVFYTQSIILNLNTFHCS